MTTVLVIGGGLAGCSAIWGLRQCNHDCKIVLVEPREYAETVWASYRSLFDRKIAGKSLHKLQPFCQNQKVTHVQACVTKLSIGKAELSNGNVLEFDVCVVATGATIQFEGLGRGFVADGTIESRKKFSSEMGNKILDSKNVLVVGGGLIGIELAGDIAGYATKRNKVHVTLVHSQSHLGPELSGKAARFVQQQLESQGVHIILNDTAVKQPDGSWKLEKSQQTLESPDMVIETTGISSANSFCQSSELSTCLNERGFLVTDDYFRVASTQGRIFAMGDCCTTLPNSASQFIPNASIIGHNIHTQLASIQAGETYDDVCFKKYVLGNLGYIVTTGPNTGVWDSPFITTRRLLPWIKNKSKCFS